MKLCLTSSIASLCQAGLLQLLAKRLYVHADLCYTVSCAASERMYAVTRIADKAGSFCVYLDACIGSVQGFCIHQVSERASGWRFLSYISTTHTKGNEGGCCMSPVLSDD